MPELFSIFDVVGTTDLAIFEVKAGILEIVNDGVGILLDGLGMLLGLGSSFVNVPCLSIGGVPGCKLKRFLI